jgi:hypothetical protein
MNGAAVNAVPLGSLLGWRILSFPLVYAGLLYVVLSYVYLSGFFFRAGFAPTPVPGIIATLFSGAVMLMAARRRHIMPPRWKRVGAGGPTTFAAPKAGQ